MNNDLIIHDATRTQLEHFVANPSHAVLLVGPNGMGKRTLAESLIARLLTADIASHPYYLTISPEGASISIESIRALQKFLQLKTVGDKPLRRAVLIEYAQALTTEAQNAFLKILEEPPADTIIVLTANSPRALLPTILSRTQTITVYAPGEDQLQAMLGGADRQAYFLSGGLPGLLHALLHQEDHPLATSVTAAKDILQKQPFERLSIVDALSKQKETAVGVVEALERIAQAGLAGAGAKADTARIKQWHRLRKAAFSARTALQRSANAKLTLTHLFLAI